MPLDPTVARKLKEIDEEPVEIMNNLEAYEEKKMDQLSGAMLRSVENHGDLVQAMRNEFVTKFDNLVLERASIYYQYHIFNNAKIIIAQHGAALSNMFFMKPTNENNSCTVIEISPPSPNVLPQFREGAKSHFKNL